MWICLKKLFLYFFFLNLSFLPSLLWNLVWESTCPQTWIADEREACCVGGAFIATAVDMEMCSLNPCVLRTVAPRSCALSIPELCALHWHWVALLSPLGHTGHQRYICGPDPPVKDWAIADMPYTLEGYCGTQMLPVKVTDLVTSSHCQRVTAN